MSNPPGGSMVIRSKVNQPDRVFVNSVDDVSQPTESKFSQFTARFQTPILGARKCQVVRATIPNAQIQLPDYALTFWYFALPTPTTTPTNAYLYCVRLYPSYWQFPTGTAATRNRFITGGSDFVDLLNTAAAAGGDNVTYNPYWYAGDITFAWNSTTQQITFTGNTASTFYTPAGYNDPLVIAAMAGQTVRMLNAVGGGTTPQPMLAEYTLNLRVGYAMSGQALVNQGTQGNARYANLTNRAYANGTSIPADSFPNLVYSSTIYLYASMIAGSSLGSNGTHNLLACVPNSALQFGITTFNAGTTNYLLKLGGDTIYEITISMTDDAGMPFALPDSANVCVEFVFNYSD
jgi:hypothetical protein